MLTALNVEITGNGGKQSIRMQVYKGFLDQPLYSLQPRGKSRRVFHLSSWL